MYETGDFDPFVGNYFLIMGPGVADVPSGFGNWLTSNEMKGIIPAPVPHELVISLNQVNNVTDLTFHMAGFLSV